jgi:hypothetical protein
VRKLVLEKLLSSEVLEIRVMHPALADTLERKPRRIPVRIIRGSTLPAAKGKAISGRPLIFTTHATNVVRRHFRSSRAER